MIDARTRCNRLADPYVWLEGYILDALCELGRRTGIRRPQSWADALEVLTDRTRMWVQRAAAPVPETIP